MISLRGFPFAACAAIVLLAAASARAQNEPEMPSECDGNTAQIVECLTRQAKVWDQRLNQAYQKLLQSGPAAQREKLRAAQRLWLQYRDANCAYYAAGEGTVARVATAECLRSMTESRTEELEQAGGPD
jgi:uncharacterized protein YecT (DUF1311 family)